MPINVYYLCQEVQAIQILFAWRWCFVIILWPWQQWLLIHSIKSCWKPTAKCRSECHPNSVRKYIVGQLQSSVMRAVLEVSRSAVWVWGRRTSCVEKTRLFWRESAISSPDICVYVHLWIQVVIMTGFLLCNVRHSFFMW